MKPPLLSTVRCNDKVQIRLTGREVEAVTLGLRTLLITMPQDEALGGVAAIANRSGYQTEPSPR